jgi:hypothetical protein
MTLRPIYLLIALAIFVVEVLIGLGIIPGTFVRHSIGDLLVTALLYFLIRGLTRTTPATALVAGVATGFLVEALQYIHLADLLGFAEGSLPYILLGNTFSLSDLLMYTIGGVLAAWADMRLKIGQIDD